MKIKPEDKKYFIGLLILVPILIGLIILMICTKNSEIKDYSRNYFYMDTIINVKIYSNNKNKANKALDEIDELFKIYHNLTDRYNSYDKGLYNLNHGNNDIDSRLYEMIKYADTWYSKSNGLLNIGIGNVVDIWKKYREAGTGVPSFKELKSVNINHNDLVIGDKIELKNGIQIDLGAISKGYTTEVVGKYLKDSGLNMFIINAGGNVLVGDYYKKTDTVYKVGIEDPTNNGKLYKIVKVSNAAVVTSGGYQRNYTYNGVTYNHIINPKTLYPANNVLSVSVISASSSDADALSTTLFLMSVEEGKEFIKNYDAEAIWYLNDGSIVTSEGFNKYE